MNTIECIKGRRSIRRYKPDPIDHSLIDSIVSAASYSPSWKNTQITVILQLKILPLLKKSQLILRLSTMPILSGRLPC